MTPRQAEGFGRWLMMHKAASPPGSPAVNAPVADPAAQKIMEMINEMLRKKFEEYQSQEKRAGDTMKQLSGPMLPYLGALLGSGAFGAIGALRPRSPDEEKGNRSRIKMILRDALIGGAIGAGTGLFGRTMQHMSKNEQPLGGALGEAAGEAYAPVGNILGDLGRATLSTGKNLASGFDRGLQ